MAKFSPYTDNGGTTVAIAGKDFAIIASDTRLSTGYSILTREQSKLFPMTPNTILASTGCWCDSLTFAKVMEMRIKNYLYEHNRVISTKAIAQIVSITLYHKRFFPYYVSNIVAGLDDDGHGVLYSYDPIGHYEETQYTAGGSSGHLIQSILDNKVGQMNIGGNLTPLKKPDIKLEDALCIVKDVFISAAERDIYCGDFVDIKIITANGTQTQRTSLRKD